MHRRPAGLTQGEKLHALGSGIGTLVILTGQILRCENLIVIADSIVFIVYIVHIRFGKDRAGCRLKFLTGKTRNIITVQDAQILNCFEAEIVAQIRHHVARFNVKSLSFFHKYACDHISSVLPQKAASLTK